MLQKGSQAIQDKYGVSADQLRIYLHYQPTYYHLHIHFNHIKSDCAGTGAGKAHLLQEVIDNISLWPDYYQKKTLTYYLKANDVLFKRLKERANTETEK